MKTVNSIFISEWNYKFYIPIKSAEYNLSCSMLNLNPFCAFQTLQAVKQRKFSANVTQTPNFLTYLVFSFPQL